MDKKHVQYLYSTIGIKTKKKKNEQQSRQLFYNNDLVHRRIESCDLARCWTSARWDYVVGKQEEPKTNKQTKKWEWLRLLIIISSTTKRTFFNLIHWLLKSNFLTNIRNFRKLITKINQHGKHHICNEQKKKKRKCFAFFASKNSILSLTFETFEHLFIGQNYIIFVSTHSYNTSTRKHAHFLRYVRYVKTLIRRWGKNLLIRAEIWKKRSWQFGCNF